MAAKFWSRSSSSASSSSVESASGFDEGDISSNDGQMEWSVNDPNAAWDSMEASQAFLDIPTESSNADGRQSSTRIVCISDTHGRHREVHLPPGDVLVHGGDFTKTGETGTIRDLSEFFAKSGFRDVVCIAGNHDATLHPSFFEEHREDYRWRGFDCAESLAAIKSNCHYLLDETLTVRNGGNVEVKFHGSPWSPEFFVWAFGLPRDAEIQKKWDLIPDDTDVLVTHGPPLGRGDLTFHNGRAGCEDLRRTVQDRVKPRLHIFGHIHEGYGVTYDGQTLYVNASVLDISYRVVNMPIVIDLPHDRTQQARVVRPVCEMTASDFVDFIEKEGHAELAERLKAIDMSELPSGNDLVEPGVFDDLRGLLFLQNRSPLLRNLQSVLGKIYASSF